MELVGTKYRFVILALALAPLAISDSASAASQNRDFPRQLYLYAPEGSSLLSTEEQTSPQRAAAIHECNTWARSIGAERDWQAATFARYGACMLEHGQRFG
jgi:hypothetical protein